MPSKSLTCSSQSEGKEVLPEIIHTAKREKNYERKEEKGESDENWSGHKSLNISNNFPGAYNTYSFRIEMLDAIRRIPKVVNIASRMIFVKMLEAQVLLISH